MPYYFPFLFSKESPVSVTLVCDTHAAWFCQNPLNLTCMLVYTLHKLSRITNYKAPMAIECLQTQE